MSDLIDKNGYCSVHKSYHCECYRPYMSTMCTFYGTTDGSHSAECIDTGGKGYKPQELVNHPDHYNKHPSGIECIQVVEHMGFNLGNVVKYCWRADLKGDDIEDLEKARWYINRELKKRRKVKCDPKNAWNVKKW